jgi:hypothetical protein
MSLAKKAQEAFDRYRRQLGLTDPPVAPENSVRTWDFRRRSVTMMPSDNGQKMYVQYHGAFGPNPRQGDYVIFKAVKPTGSRYRVTTVDWSHDVDWAWFAHLEFAPRTDEEVEADERSAAAGPVW